MNDNGRRTPQRRDAPAAGSAHDPHERSKNAVRGWLGSLLYPSLLLFTLVKLQASTISRELANLGRAMSSRPSSPVGASSRNQYEPLINSYSTSSSSQKETADFDSEDNDILSQHELEEEAVRLLSHVLVTIAYWHSPTGKEVKFLGHTLGTIREWRLLPQIGNVTVVIVTNDATAAKESLGRTNGDWYTFHEVDAGEMPFHMPFYHREVVADYLDRSKAGVNMTHMLNEELIPPTAYSFMEADNVLDGAGLLAWARDTALLRLEGASNTRVRHFWRWEWNADQNCPVFTGQIFRLSRSNSEILLSIGGKRFVSMTDNGIWAGMYVLTSQHMLNYYKSGKFWTLPDKYKYAREIQLHDMVHGSNVVGRPDKLDGDNTLVPYDEGTGTVDVIAGVHHQSDKYVNGRRFSKLCVRDLFT